MGLSLMIEVLQYYDAGRDSEATDLYAHAGHGDRRGHRLVLRARFPLAAAARDFGQSGAGAAHRIARLPALPLCADYPAKAAASRGYGASCPIR